VPAARVFAPGLLLQREGAGVVIVKRDSGFLGSGCADKIFADASPVADLDPGEKVTFYLPVGDHIVSALPNDPCGGGMVEIGINVSVEKSVTLRIGSGTNGDFGIYLTAF
jgi:hypothetical protein